MDLSSSNTPAVMDKPRIAVIGLGIAGLTAVKNCLEIGLDVEGFERNNYIGGLWKYNTDPEQLSVLKSTYSNGSKNLISLTDFPFPDDAPAYVSASSVADYFERYTEYFKLSPCLHLNTTILSIAPTDKKQWRIKIRNNKGERNVIFDKVIVTTGPFQIPRIPNIEGLHDHPERVWHSKQYKEPEAFRGKKVIVIGTGNTACDICMELLDVAEKTYVSYRSGQALFKKTNPPVDDMFTRQRFCNLGKALRRSKEEGKQALEAAHAGLSKGFEMAWPNVDLYELGLLPTPPLDNTIPGLGDEFIPALAAGRIHRLGEITNIGPDRVATVSGQTIDYDVIIAATGYKYDFSLLTPAIDPTNHPDLDGDWNRAKHAEGLDFPRLYQGIFHPEHGGSLAFLGPMDVFSLANPSNFDLATCAIAQVFSGNFALPTKSAMYEWCEENYRHNLDLIKSHRIPRIRIKQYELESFLNEAAGTGVNELDGNEPGLSRTDPELYQMIMEGKPAPFLYRLFEGRKGGRKKWDDARQAIMWANGKAAPPARANYSL